MNSKLSVDLIAIDIGGTLTVGRDQDDISSLNRKAIKVLQKLRKVFVIATGRALTRTMPIIQQLKPSYAVCSTGGLIYSAISQKILHIFPINKKFRQKLLTKLHLTKNIFTAFQCINKKEELISYYWGEPNQAFFKMKVKINNLYPLKNTEELKKWAILRISIYGNPQNLFFFAEFLKPFDQVIDYYIEVNKVVQITHKNISKGSGVAFVAKKIGVNKQKIMAFGNSYNDASMFKVANYGIAIVGAEDKLKTIAFAETDAPNQSGVGKALYKWVIPD